MSQNNESQELNQKFRNFKEENTGGRTENSSGPWWPLGNGAAAIWRARFLSER